MYTLCIYSIWMFVGSNFARLSILSASPNISIVLTIHCLLLRYMIILEYHFRVGRGMKKESCRLRPFLKDLCLLYSSLLCRFCWRFSNNCFDKVYDLSACFQGLFSPIQHQHSIANLLWTQWFKSFSWLFWENLKHMDVLI